MLVGVSFFVVLDSTYFALRKAFDWLPTFLMCGSRFVLAGALLFSAHEIDIAAILLAPVVWALRSVWSKRLPLPKGLMATAAQMLTAGVSLFPVAVIRGETPPTRFVVSNFFSFS